MADEIKPELIQKTQKILGKHISKPVLSEKLLRKPPFRFLHDIITAIIKDTGFLKGLFTETELISDNVKERDAKITFLTKLIEAVKTITEIDLKVKPTKIIAGLEPSETNKLLQALGFALDKRLDSSEYIKKINSKSKVTDKSDKAKKTSKNSVRDDKSKDSVRAKKSEVQVTKNEKSKKKNENNSDAKSQEKGKKKSKKDSDRKEEAKILESPKINEDVKEITDIRNDGSHLNENKKEEKIIEPSIIQKNEGDEMATKIENIESELPQNLEFKDEVQKKIRSNRPKSARPQSGDFKKISSNKMEKMEDNSSVQNDNLKVRPASSLRPPSVRPPSARPGAPRLRPESALPLHEMVPLGKINVIVENYNGKELDEEETVVIQSAEAEPEPVHQILNIPEDKGHLVEQILEQIHDNDVVEHVKTKNEIDWEGEGFRNRDATNREINQLRTQIQSLTRVANPLGKLMNYLHEDVESMLAELNIWMNMKKEMYKEINKQKKINDEASKPLMLHLQELEELIKKQEVEIVNIRSNILRNELRIKDLLMK